MVERRAIANPLSTKAGPTACVDTIFLPDYHAITASDEAERKRREAQLRPATPEAVNAIRHDFAME